MRQRVLRLLACGLASRRRERRRREGRRMTGIAPVKRVLIVEDDQDVRGALAAFLEGEGHSVVEAAHGAEALTRLHDSDGICLIVLDLWMPVMDGWEFRAAQRKDPTLAAV
ncbi:MAG: response regulator, partial [Deltaproteobacteria bacterium]